MTVPDFQSMMLPFLYTFADGQEWLHKDIVKAIADKLNVILPKVELFPTKMSWHFFNNGSKRMIVKILPMGDK